jgi:tetrapyrrole methylase family protein / MazG family protein
MTITIVGLGPGRAVHLTREAWDLLCQVDEVYVRTMRHPTVSDLPTHLRVHSFDHLYEALADFSDVYEAIAEQVIALGRRPQGVVYAVPGHPRMAESSVQRILARAQEEGLPVRLVEGLSFVEPVLTLLGLDGILGNRAGLQLADATDLATAHHPSLDPDRPALIGQLYGQRLASEVKLTLMNAYPDDHPVILVQAAGLAECRVVTFPLYKLDRGQPLDHLTTLYIPPLSHPGGLPAFQETVAHLRAPDGCPWDREQTHQTLRNNLLEETYEVLATLDAGDPDKLCDELGDLLMQIAMHVQIATEAADFRFADVIGRIDAKLKRRHPHVFGDVVVEGTPDVLRNWEAIKARERASDSGEGQAYHSLLESVPAVLPALARAQAIGERVARTGFDWPNLNGVLAKLDEEIAEVRAAQSPECQEQEMGDLLFTLVNAARWLQVDCESALRSACDRFVWRYREMEQAARAQGRVLADLSPAEQDALWEQAKSCK